MSLRFATRPSALAIWQTQSVIAELQKAHPGLVCEQKIISTQGDKIIDRPLPEIGGKGLFTRELENELFSGEVDCAVHSLKDLPVEDTPGLIIGCIPARAEARDALVSAQGYTLKTLPSGARLGTSSLRRAAQVLAVRPDLNIESLRGNVDTRLRKVLDGQYDAILLAGAGLVRLSLEEHVSEWLPFEIVLPAPGQGALAVQCRGDDLSTLNLLAALEDRATRQAVTAERNFLLCLGGGCAVPVAAYATLLDEIKLTGIVASTDGKHLIKVSGAGIDPEELGKRLAYEALSQGADDILKKVVVKSL